MEEPVRDKAENDTLCFEIVFVGFGEACGSVTAVDYWMLDVDS